MSEPSLRPTGNEFLGRKERLMGDILYLALGLGAFGLLSLYVFGCGRA